MNKTLFFKAMNAFLGHLSDLRGGLLRAILPYALRAALRAFKNVPDIFVEPRGLNPPPTLGASTY